jgi:2,3-bisphosphoglycerate-independent phosphoglycerate mutase
LTLELDQTIKNGELNKNEVLVQTFEKAKNGNGRLHLCVSFIAIGAIHVN